MLALALLQQRAEHAVGEEFRESRGLVPTRVRGHQPNTDIDAELRDGLRVVKSQALPRRARRFGHKANGFPEAHFFVEQKTDKGEVLGPRRDRVQRLGRDTVQPAIAFGVAG